MRHKIMSKEGIMLAAETIIREEGLAKCSMRRLAKEMGVGAGTIYNYYPTRDTLLGDVFDHSWEQTFIGSKKLLLADTTVMEGLQSMYDILERDIRNRNGLGHELFLLENRLDNQRTKKLKKQLIDIIIELVKSAFEEEAVSLKVSRWILLIFMDAIASEEGMDEVAWIRIGKLLDQ